MDILVADIHIVNDLEPAGVYEVAVPHSIEVLSN
jgi:hypothetical protein